MNATAHPIKIDSTGWPTPAKPGDAGAPLRFPVETPGSVSVDFYREEQKYWSKAAWAERLNSVHNRWFFLRNLARYAPAVRRAALGQFFRARLPRSE